MITTRIAPSPTGYVHIGNLRTMLYNYLFAKKQGGRMLLRIEDTDQERYVEGAVESLLLVLKTVGITYEGKPVVQSERLPLYKKHAEELITAGKAYYCFCSKERLEDLRRQQEIAKRPTKYDRHCFSIPKNEAAERVTAGESAVVRLLMPDGKTTFTDLIRGVITIDNQEIDDQVLMKSDGFPTYHLAVVVDDHDMEITHIIRGEEWLSSVPKHLALYAGFGWKSPEMAHLPLILNPDRSKLSKRQGDVAVEDYLKKGYLPEALVNFMALLGWNPKADQDIYAMDELISLFDIEKVNKSGAVFDVAKLDWMNGEYLRKLSSDELMKRIKPFLTESIDQSLLKKILVVEQGRLIKLIDLNERLSMYTQMPKPDPKVLVWKKADANDGVTQLTNIAELIKNLPDEAFDSIQTIEQAIKDYVTTNGLQNGNVFWPLRVALSGSAQSPSPFELLWVFGKDESLKRIASAVDLLKAHV